jgi:hypothetical protein
LAEEAGTDLTLTYRRPGGTPLVAGWKGQNSTFGRLPQEAAAKRAWAEDLGAGASGRWEIRQKKIGKLKQNGISFDSGHKRGTD